MGAGRQEAGRKWREERGGKTGKKWREEEESRAGHLTFSPGWWDKDVWVRFSPGWWVQPGLKVVFVSSKKTVGGIRTFG